MNLDFRKLSRAQQVEAINEVLTQDNHGPEQLAYLIASEDYDVYGWFDFFSSEKGVKYWIDLRLEKFNELLNKEE
jgi:hypothetical protein